MCLRFVMVLNVCLIRFVCVGVSICDRLLVMIDFGWWIILIYLNLDIIWDFFVID